jgi:hypothetical protein
MAFFCNKPDQNPHVLARFGDVLRRKVLEFNAWSFAQEFLPLMAEADSASPGGK